MRDPSELTRAELIQEVQVLDQRVEALESHLETLKESQALIEDNRFLRAVVESLPFEIWACDESERYILQNSQAMAYWGECVGKAVEELENWPEKTLLQWKEENHRAFGGEPIYKEGERLINGEKRAYSSFIGPVRDGDAVLGIVGVHMDTTERRQAQEIIQLRLDLTEYASTHSLEELLRNTLDEIGRLTNSPIGFFHFVEADEQALSLQAWSTRTLDEFCQAEGKGMHYPIEQAGVWTDCIRERRPVIHNDYGSLPHRKGMPEGHAQVVRELVVPILKGDRIVAILGVGNRPQEYTEREVELVTNIADIAWEIAERKRVEEALQESEERYRTFVEDLPIGVYRTTPGIEGKHMIANSFYLRMFGYDSIEKLAQETPVSGMYLNPGERKRFSNEVLSKGHVDRVELQLKRSDGTPIWGAVTASVGHGKDGEAYFDCVIEDITERKQVEEALYQANLVVENSPVVLFRWKAAEGWPVVMVSQNVIQFGYTPEELLSGGVPFATLIHPEDLDRVTRELREYAKSGRDRFQQEYRILTRDGNLRWVDDRTVVERNADGQIEFYQGTVIDITERKRTEEALREGEDRFRSIVEHALAGMFTINDAYHFIYVNDELCRILGYTEDQLIGKDFREVLSKESLELVSERYVRRQRGEDVPPRYEMSVVRSDGEVRHVEMSVTVVKDKEGNVLSMGQLVDITERQRARKELEETKVLLEATLEQTPVPMVLLSAPDGVIRIANTAAVQFLTDGSEPIPLGQRLRDYQSTWQDFDSQGRPVSLDKLPLTLALQGVVTRNEEHSVVRKDGSRRWSLTSAGPIYNTDGTQIAAFVAFPEITERKQAEEDREQALAMLEAALAQSPSGILIADAPDVVIRWANSAALNIRGDTDLPLTGIDAGLHSDNWQVFLPDGQPYPSKDLPLSRAVLKGEIVRDEEAIILNAAGEKRWISANAAPVRNREGEVISGILVFQDISDYKRADIEIRRLNEELERRVAERTYQLEAANKELEAFSYSVSHDLRAPLRAIDGFSRILMEDHAGQLSDDVTRLLGIIRDNTQQMGRLIDDLLAFSRLGRQRASKQRVNTARLVRKVLETLQSDLEGREVEIEIGKLPPCQGDPTLLKQVWMNLLSNALKFTREREVARIKIGCKKEKGTHVFYVKDNGVGFDMQYADKLFGVFQRLHRSDKFEGTGVGLAIVQRIVKRHGGEVWVEGVVGQGATFYFTLHPDKDIR